MIYVLISTMFNRTLSYKGTAAIVGIQTSASLNINVSTNIQMSEPLIFNVSVNILV